MTLSDSGKHSSDRMDLIPSHIVLSVLLIPPWKVSLIKLNTQQQKSWNIESILISVQKHSSLKLVESSSVNKCCWILIWIIIIAQNLSADFQWVLKLYFSLRKWENYFKIISAGWCESGFTIAEMVEWGKWWKSGDKDRRER